MKKDYIKLLNSISSYLSYDEYKALYNVLECGLHDYISFKRFRRMIESMVYIDEAFENINYYAIPKLYSIVSEVNDIFWAYNAHKSRYYDYLRLSDF